jgi:hypothetical protein
MHAANLTGKRFIPGMLGERPNTASSQPAYCGSSPRTRGTLPLLRQTAGRLTVHPRVRAERNSGALMVSSLAGSSPRRGDRGIIDIATVHDSGSSPRMRGTLLGEIKARDAAMRSMAFLICQAGGGSC